MLKTAISNLFGIRYPVIQGGMAHLATAELASAVSNAGGLGFLAAANYDAVWLRQQIQFVRQSTHQPFGVNLYLPSPLIKEQIQVILEEKVPVVATGAGNPGPYLQLFKESGLKVMVVVGNVQSARNAESSGADAVVAEGMEAGGHIGKIATLALVPQIVDAVRIPVLAAGGIADGRGLVAALALGAQGVQMGTRFICSEECPAHISFKLAILAAGDMDTVVIDESTATPSRVLVNQFTRDYAELKKSGATDGELAFFAKGRFKAGMIEGNIAEGALLAGQNSGLIKGIKPVKVIIKDIIEEAESLLAKLCRQTQLEESNA